MSSASSVRARMIASKPSSVAVVFFSDANVDALHDAIRYRVWVESSRSLTIGRQSEEQLVFVMRSIFLSDAENREGGREEILEQVRVLNQSVIDFCVPQVVREARMYREYLRNASTLPVPLSREQMTSKKGEKIIDMSDMYMADLRISPRHQGFP